MEFVIIDENEYRKFWENHPLRTFLSAPEITLLRKKTGWDSYFVGLKDKKKLVGAALLLRHKRRFDKYEFYAPRGVLVDYNDQETLEVFLKEIKKFVQENNGYVFRMDPYVIYKERDIDGNIVDGGIDNSDVVKSLEKIGFKRLDVKDREQVSWMFCLDLDKTPDELLKNMRSFTKRNIKKGLNNSIHIRELEYEELHLIKELTDATCERKGFDNRDLKYFQNMYKLFKPLNEISYIVAEINMSEYISKFTNEINKCEENLKRLKEMNSKIEKINKQQEEIDLLKEKVNSAKKLQEEHGDIILLSGGVFVTVGDEMVYLFGGNYKEYMYLCAPYVVQWEMINRAITDKNIKRYNFYGIPADINTHPKDYGVYDFKKGFNGYVEELIGEFVLPITWHYKLFKLIHKLRKH